MILHLKRTTELSEHDIIFNDLQGYNEARKQNNLLPLVTEVLNPQSIAMNQWMYVWCMLIKLILRKRIQDRQRQGEPEADRDREQFCLSCLLVFNAQSTSMLILRRWERNTHARTHARTHTHTHTLRMAEAITNPIQKENEYNRDLHFPAERDMVSQSPLCKCCGCNYECVPWQHL